MIHDTAVITCFFNFCDYKAPQRNLRRWQRQMETYGAHVFGVELVLPHQTPVSKDWPNWFSIQVFEGLHLLWQKEPCLNLLVNRLPEQFTKVVVCDCDVYFDNPHWLAQTSAVLDVVNACSPYHVAKWTDEAGKISRERVSMGSDHTALIPSWKAHPGFSVALRRDFWSPDGPNGIYPFYVVGNGDTALGVALCGVDPTVTSIKMFRVGNILDSYMEWYARVRAWLTGFTYVKGNLYHEHHGQLSDRKYYERLEWIQGFDPATYVKFTDDGLLEWTEHAPRKMVEDVASYFVVRKEDD